MSNASSLKFLKVSMQDFKESGWKEVIANANDKGYSALYTALSTAAASAIDEGRAAHGKVLRLLADSCSMLLSPSSPNEPFKPLMESRDSRSVIPDDLLDDDIRFFSEIVDLIDHDWLKARISDLLWLKGKPRNIEFANKAIDAYRRIPLDADAWIRGGRDCWPRAISLARMLKGGAGDRLKEMEAAIITAFNVASREDSFLGLWLAEIMWSNRLGQASQIDVAKKLEALACEFDDEGDLHRAREYFSVAAKWYKTIPDEAKTAEMIVKVAKGWVNEAVALSTSEAPSHMAAASCYEKAIQTYRTVSRAERATHQVDERITELRARLNDSGARARVEMWSVQAPGVDISRLIESARKAVMGKSAEHALLAFANLHRGVNAVELRDSVLKNIRQNPLPSLFPATVMSNDGRVIARRPVMSLDEDLTADDEVAIRDDMIRDYRFLVGVVVQGCIWPALEVLLLEHRLREVDFNVLARNSPIVPKDRAGLFGKALFAGYERDFVTALHVLIPQIEHMVRVHLKQAGATTTNLDKDGIETENGMSTLMALPEATQVFGKDLVFEITSLFCDPFGPNLRNELAHGLLDEDRCKSVYAIYAWWFALRLTVNTWWNSAASDVEQPEVNEEQRVAENSAEKQGEP